MQENEDQDDEHDVQADIASHVKAIQARKPTSEISYIDLVNSLQPAFASLINSVCEANETWFETDRVEWYTEAFMALCTTEESRYGKITPDSFDRARKVLQLDDPKTFVNLIEVLFDVVTPVCFYGFVSDENTQKLLWEENQWLLRFKNDKLVVTQAKKGNGGKMEYLDHDFEFTGEDFVANNSGYQASPKLTEFLENFPTDCACGNSPILVASSFACKEFFNHYDYPMKPFHEAWQSITHGPLGEITDAHLVNWFDVYRRTQFSDTQWESYVKSSLFRLFSSNTNVRTNTVQLLRRCAREVKLPDDLLFNICTCCRGEELSSVLETVFGFGLDTNVTRVQTSGVDRPLHAFALRDHVLPYLLKHPKIDVNALDHFDQTPLLRSAENPKAAKIFLNDPRVDVNASTAPQKEFDYFISRCKDVEVIRLLMAKGVKLTQKGNYLRIVLESERPLNDKIALWKLLIDAGIDIDTSDYPPTTLHLATMSGTADEVAALLDLGADINGKQSCSDSPLHAAAARGNISVTQLLLKRGADPKRKNLAGKTAEEVAVYATKQLFRKVAPALEIEHFFGHRIHFAGESAPAGRTAVDLHVTGGKLWVQGGMYRELRRDYEHSDYYAMCPHFDLWCTPIDEVLSDPNALATWTEIPVAHGIDFCANTTMTVKVNRELWYFGYSKNWIKYDTSTSKWSLNSPCLNDAHYWLKTHKGYDRGSYIVFPSKYSTYRIDKVTGAVTSQGFTQGSEDIEKITWNYSHVLLGDKVWLKAEDKTVPENAGIEYMFCLDLGQDKWFKVCPVPFEINSGMTAFSTHYLVTATFNQDTEEFKLVVVDTDSLKWTTHEVALIDNERLVACEELSLIVHGTRLIIFGGHVKEDTCTNALYSIDLSPIHGVHSLASIAARVVVASQHTLTQHEIDRLPQDIKTKMGFEPVN